MNARVIGYWITTALVAFSMVSGGVMDVLRGDQVMEGMRHLGYPDYFAVILGVWKIAGGLAIVLPKLPLVKEWAYAGIIFDLTGASASHAAAGDPAFNIVVPVVIALITAGSWWLRPASRKLPGIPGAA